MKRIALLAGILTLFGAAAYAQSQTTPATAPTLQLGGTVTTGGTFQTVLPANSSRSGCTVQNTGTHTGYVYWFSGTPSLTNSLQIPAGGAFYCANSGGFPIKTAIQYTTGTTGDPFVYAENQ